MGLKKKKKKKKTGRKLVFTCLESPLTQQEWTGRNSREGMFLITSTADMLLPRKPPESSGTTPNSIALSSQSRRLG